jgi:hypothetical protein
VSQRVATHKPVAQTLQQDASDLVHEANFDISEFFDLENAALESNDVGRCALDPQSIASTPGLTLQSMGSKSSIRTVIETSGPVSQSAVVNAYSIDRFPKPAWPVAAVHASPNWPIEHYVSQVQLMMALAFLYDS